MDLSMITPRTCVLKVNINCPACEKKVYKRLQKITGVRSIAIAREQGQVTVAGAIDPCMLLKALAKIGKRAEILWDSSDSMNLQTNNQNQYVQASSMATQTPELDQQQLDLLSKIERLKQVELIHNKTIKVTFKDEDDNDVDDLCRSVGTCTTKFVADDFSGQTVVHRHLDGGCGGGATAHGFCCHDHGLNNGRYYGGSGGVKHPLPPADGWSHWGPGCAPSAPPVLPPAQPAAQPYARPRISSGEDPNCCTVM